LPINSSHKEELLRQVAAGDEYAFNRLVAIHWDRVFSHAMTYTLSYLEAEEITQDIFLKIWNNREKLEQVNNLLDYLFILGRNHIISSLRKKVVKTTAIDSDYRIAEELLPDRQLEIKQLKGLILKGMEQLPPQQQNVFRLARMEGLAYDEIADRLKITKRTVRFHMVLAFNFLREYIRNHLHDIYIVVIFLVRITLR